MRPNKTLQQSCCLPKVIFNAWEYFQSLSSTLFNIPTKYSQNTTSMRPIIISLTVMMFSRKLSSTPESTSVAYLSVSKDWNELFIVWVKQSYDLHNTNQPFPTIWMTSKDDHQHQRVLPNLCLSLYRCIQGQNLVFFLVKNTA